MFEAASVETRVWEAKICEQKKFILATNEPQVRLRQVRIRLPTLAVKPRGDITRSAKQGYQWPHKKDLCPPKILKKITHTNQA